MWPSPTPSATVASPPKRQSCDRCHSQKLRCRKTLASSGSGGSCDRCLRKRTPCVYSTSLPKGRPSMYRLAGEIPTASAGSGTEAGPVASIGESIGMGAHTGTGTAAGTGARTATSNRACSTTAPPTPVSPPPRPAPLCQLDAKPPAADVGAHSSPSEGGATKVASAASAQKDASANGTRDGALEQGLSLPEPMDTTLDMAVSTWSMSWVEATATEWDDTQLDWSDQDSGQSVLNWHTMINLNPNSTAVSGCPSSIETLSSPLSRASTGNSAGLEEMDTAQEGPGPPSSSILGLGIRDPLESCLSRSVSSGILQKPTSNSHNDTSGNVMGSGEPDTIIQDRNGDLGDLAVMQLCQLSMRLSPLQRASRTLAETAETARQFRDGNKPGAGAAHELLLMDDDAFESVAAWLARGSAWSEMSINPHVACPPEAHYAAHNLFPTRPGAGAVQEPKRTGRENLLRDVFSASHHLLEILTHLQSRTDTSSASTRAPSASADLPLLLTKGRSPSTTPSRSRQQPSDTVVHHFIIACHTLLLDIHRAVLAALQSDAETIHVGFGPDRAAASLGNIRLASVVHLCSYLVERQQQAVDLFMMSTNNVNSHHQSRIRLETANSQDDRDLLSAGDTHQATTAGMGLAAADREVIGNLQLDIRQRLACLKQTLCI